MNAAEHRIQQAADSTRTEKNGDGSTETAKQQTDMTTNEWGQAGATLRAKSWINKTDTARCILRANHGLELTGASTKPIAPAVQP